MSPFLDYVETDFDNVLTKFLCSILVLVATGMSCVVTPNLLQPVLFKLLPLETVTTSIFLFSISTLSRQSFPCRDRISSILE